MLGDFESLLGDSNPIRSCSTIDARTAHCPKMHFQLQEDIISQIDNQTSRM